MPPERHLLKDADQGSLPRACGPQQEDSSPALREYRVHLSRERVTNLGSTDEGTRP